MAVVFNITMHARHPRQLGRFWSAVLDYPVVQDSDDLVRLRGPGSIGAPDLLILRADSLPHHGGRTHIDLAATDIDAESRRLVALGAVLVDGSTAAGPKRRSANGIDGIVLADPEGNEFCLGNAPDITTP